MRIVVEIDRVILEGLAARIDTKRLGVAIEQELSRSLAIVPMKHWHSTSSDKVDANVALAGIGAADAIGRRLATAVHAAIGGVAAPRYRPQPKEQAHGRPLR